MLPTLLPGLSVQQAPIQGQLPMVGPQQIISSGIPTSSIKYTTQVPQTTVLSAQPMIVQSTLPATTILSPSRQTINTVNTIQQPIISTIQQQPIIASPVHATQFVGAAIQTNSQVITGARCPPPVQGQPIIIEGAVTGAQSYIEPVRQTVLLQGAAVRPELSQVVRGESRFEYVPYEQVVTEYDQLEKRIRIPINKYITEYQVIDHQIEYIPEISYQTQTDYIPQQRIEEEVQYSTQEKRIEHGIKQEMRTSQRIEGGAIATATIAQPTTTIVQSTVPAVQTYQTQIQPVQTYQTVQTVQAAPVVNVHSSRVYTTGPQIVNTSYGGVAYSQAPVTVQAPIATTFSTQMPQMPIATQWPTTWTSNAYEKRKSS